ncbi:MAG: response regulator transcription factor [Micrococcales bacterium]|nr:response regulator transcription factor [Micrococcales bacterium]
MTVRVLLVDDQALVRSGLRMIIDATEDLHVVGETQNGVEALAFLSRLPVDVVLMDLHMPGIDGVETTRRIRARLTAQQTRIIVLTTFDQDENVIAALRAGANGFLSKGVSPAELIAGITEVADGGGALSARAAAALIDHVAGETTAPIDPVAAARFDYLTGREREIVEAAAEGLDNAAIAKKLFISQLTVKTHISRAMMKVDVHDRAALLALAYRAGISP